MLGVGFRKLVKSIVQSELWSCAIVQIDKLTTDNNSVGV